MITNALIIPIASCLLNMAISMVFAKDIRYQKISTLIGLGVFLLSSLYVFSLVAEHTRVVAYLGSWRAPFGISLVADRLSALMLLVTGLMGLLVGIYSLFDFDGVGDSVAFYPSFHALLLGVSGAFLTGDMFNLYVWFEVMLLASFVLLTLTKSKHCLEGALKYVSLNLVSSAIFLSALGILYSVCQSLNMADLYQRLSLVEAEQPYLILIMAFMFLVSFGIKAGLFPLFFWLPASYHTPPTAVTAIFSALLTKVGVYCLFRVFINVFPANDTIYTVVLVLACLTMILGVLGAVSKFEVRKILSFHIISQIGYLVLGLGLLLSNDYEIAVAAVAASIFYMIHNIFAKTSLFLVGGAIKAKTSTNELASLGSMIKLSPFLAVLFLISAFSLAGIPPFSGFWAKLNTVFVSVQGEFWLVAFLALAASILTLLSMMKIWNEVFWKKNDEVEILEIAKKNRLFLYSPIIVLAVLLIVVGLQPSYLYDYSKQAAKDLLDRQAYVEAVAPIGKPSITHSAESSEGELTISSVLEKITQYLY